MARIFRVDFNEELVPPPFTKTLPTFGAIPLISATDALR